MSMNRGSCRKLVELAGPEWLNKIASALQGGSRCHLILPGILPTDPWQRRLLPLMRAALVLMALFFFVASLYQYQQLYSDLQQHAPSALAQLDRLEQRLPAAERGNLDYVRWRTMVALEQDAMQMRYQKVNASLLLRTWTRYTGFLVGMVLAMVGAFFILGKLREDQTQASGEGGGFKFTVASSSPGIVLATLGSALMAITLIVKFDFDISDKPIYILPHGVSGLTTPARPPEMKDGADLTPLPGGTDIPKPPGEARQ